MFIGTFLFEVILLAQYDGSIRINTKITTKEASAQLMTLENRIVKTADKVASLRSKMDALKDSKIPTTEYREVSNQISKAELEFNKLLEKQEQMQREGKDSGVAWERLNEKMEEVGNTIRYAQGELQSLVDTGKAFTPGSDTEEFAKLGQQLQYAENDMAVLNKRHDELTSKQGKSSAGYKKLGETAKKSFEKINKSAKKSGSLLSTLASRFKGLALSLLIFNQISKAFNAMMSGIREGIGNLARYSTPVNAALSSMKSALTQLKNSLATAFAPILTTVAPILTSFINMLSKAATYVGMLIAALTGQKMFTKAAAVQEQYADALGDTASNAKDANKQLSSLDKLNNLTSDSGGGGGGGGGGGLSPGDMFETVPIENDIISFAERIKKVFADMFAPLKAAWAEYGDSIKATLSKIWQNFVDFGARIGQSTYEWFKNLNWEPLLSSVDKLLKSLEPLIDLILDGLAWAWENVLLPFGKWTIEEAIPAILNLISAALGALNEVLIALEPLGTWLWENFLQPLGEWAGDIIIGALETITDLLEKFGDWVSEHQEAVQNFAIIIGSFAAAWGLVTAAMTIWSGVAAIASGVTTALGAAIAFLTSPIGLAILAIGAIIAIGVLLYKNWDEISAKAKEVWDFVKKKFQEFDDYLHNIFAHDWSREFGIIGDVINGFNKTIEHVWDSVKQVFGGIIDFVAGIFTGDLNRVLDGIVNIFSGFGNLLVAVIKAPANAIIGIINGLIRGITIGINGIANMLNGLKINIPDWVPGIGGGKIGFNIPTFNPPQIPYLAQGAVIPANKEFMAVLGDQKHGRNLEAPEDLIRQIVREESAKVGGEKITFEIPIILDGREIARVVQEYDRDYFNRTGRPMFSY